MSDDVPEFTPDELKAIREGRLHEGRRLSQRALADAIGCDNSYISKIESGQENLTPEMARVYQSLSDGTPLEELGREWQPSKPRVSKRDWTTILSEEVAVFFTDEGFVRYIYRRILLQAGDKAIIGHPLYYRQPDKELSEIAVEGGELVQVEGTMTVGIKFPKPILPGEKHFIQIASIPDPDLAESTSGSCISQRLDWYDLQNLTVLLLIPPHLRDQYTVERVHGLPPMEEPTNLYVDALTPTTNGLARVEFKKLVSYFLYGLMWRRNDS